MEEKHNNATQRRPEGARPLDAPMIPVDIPKYIAQLQEEDAYQKNGKNAITVFKSDHLTITIIALKEGQEFHPGQSDETAIMSLQVIKGYLVFESVGSVVEISEGSLVTLHHELAFKARATADSVYLLTLFR